MKSASLSHQYLTVISNKTNDIFFGGGSGARSRGSQKNQLQNLQTDHNHLINSATDPLSRRSISLGKSTPSVAVITRSLSDSTNPCVVYKSETTNKGKYQ